MTAPAPRSAARERRATLDHLRAAIARLEAAQSARDAVIVALPDALALAALAARMERRADALSTYEPHASAELRRFARDLRAVLTPR